MDVIPKSSAGYDSVALNSFVVSPAIFLNTDCLFCRWLCDLFQFEPLATSVIRT